MIKEFNYQELLDSYAVDETLTKAHIYHLYDTGIRCELDNSGYYDSRHFNCIAFNIDQKTKRDLGRHDGISPFVQVDLVRIFADGSTIIRTKKLSRFLLGQDIILLNGETND